MRIPAAISLLLLMLFAMETAQSATSAGQTIVANGDVNATDRQGARQLARRSEVFVVDTVNTGSASSTQLKMVDDGILTLQQLSELAIANYQFNQATKEGTVLLTLLSGGLRAVTGAIKSGVNNYRLDTPVASIGVRGTHFEVELKDGVLYVAVWDGILDIDVKVASADQQFSLGDDEDYNFAIISPDGSVSFELEIPMVFARGHSRAFVKTQPAKEPEQEQASTVEKQHGTESEQEVASAVEKQQETESEQEVASTVEKQQGTESEQEVASAIKKQQEAESEQELALAIKKQQEADSKQETESEQELALASVIYQSAAETSELTAIASSLLLLTGDPSDQAVDLTGQGWVNNEQQWVEILPVDSSVIASRTGEAVFGLASHGLGSSFGPISDIEMIMEVDFNSAEIPTGQISFSDSAGLWFAVYNGIIGQDGLELGINFASHGNQVAFGSINGVFVDGGSQILGNIELNEQEQPDNNAGGGFLLSDSSDGGP